MAEATAFLSNPSMSDRIEVARVGRKVGLKGFSKLQILSDFPEFFTPGRTFVATRGDETRELTIDAFYEDRGEVRFRGVNTPEAASELTHFVLSTTVEETRKAIRLEEGEHFWFDIIGLAVYEGEVRIGTAEQIDDAGQVYLAVKLDDAFNAKQSRLLLPWIDRFIIGVDTEAKRIRVAHALELLEAL